MKYLISAVHTIRVSTVEEVEKLHEELKKDDRFTLKKFEYTHKEVKSKGEIIDEYELVKATLIFNNEKEPDTDVTIDYKCDVINFGGYSDDEN